MRRRDVIVAAGFVAAILPGCSGAERPRPAVAIATSAPAPALPAEAPWAPHLRELEGANPNAGAAGLVALFEQETLGAGRGLKAPTVKPLVDAITGPLAAACSGGRLDARTTSLVLKFSVSVPDPRAEDCAIKALDGYRPEETEDDVRSALRIVTALKSSRAAPSLLDVFGKLRASRPRAQTIYRDVYDAMNALCDKSWTPKLIAALEVPVVDFKATKEMLDQQFWQVGAAHLLGTLRASEAVRPPLKILLSPAKDFAATTAVVALVNIGKPAIAPTVALLRGEDAELVAYSTKEASFALGPRATARRAAASAHIATAALVLATIGRDETEAPLLTALARAPNDVTRALIARELTKIPKSAATVAAFKRAYERTPVFASVPPGAGARETLLEASTMFFDPGLVPWYVDSAIAMKGEESDVAPIREASLIAALKLMKADQVTKVEELARRKATDERGGATTIGAGFAPEMARAKDLLARCGDKVACYIQVIGEARAQEQDNQFVGIKAAYMIGVLGSPAAREGLVAQMPKITNAAVRFVAVWVLDHLSPKGDAALAAELQAIVDAGEASRDPNQIARNAPFKVVIERLRVRAE